MYPLVMLSLWMWFLIAKKLKDMYAFNVGQVSLQDCLRTMGTDKFSASNWQQSIVEGFLKGRTEDNDLNQMVLENLRLRQEDYVKGSVGTISLLAAIAPLLGLLGTVGGMIKTFAVIAEFGTGNARALASGISEALITTQTGLVVAVPGLFLAGFLARRSELLLQEMERFCMGISGADRGESDPGE